MSVDIARILNAAADLIEPDGAWTQGAAARNADGKVSLENATCWCLYGAIGNFAEESWDVVWEDFKRLSGIRAPIAWNDAPERTQSEVVEALRAAALANGAA